MLVNGREQMVQRAVRSFYSQTYDRKSLLVYDTGDPPVKIGGFDSRTVHVVEPANGRPIGSLRNAANDLVSGFGFDVVAHWDSDDWSAPGRLVDQLQLMEASGAQVVGYREMLFWDSTKCQIRVDPSKPMPGGGVEGTVESVGEAWLYSNPNPKYCLGTSLLYPIHTWTGIKFPPKVKGEDNEWCLRLKTASTSAGVADPLMIASIHGGNTGSKILLGYPEWMRLSSSDETCRKRMKL